MVPEFGARLGSDESQAGNLLWRWRRKGSKLLSLAIKIGLTHRHVKFGYKLIMCHPRAQAQQFACTFRRQPYPIYWSKNSKQFIKSLCLQWQTNLLTTEDKLLTVDKVFHNCPLWIFLHFSSLRNIPLSLCTVRGRMLGWKNNSSQQTFLFLSFHIPKICVTV